MVERLMTPDCRSGVRKNIGGSNPSLPTRIIGVVALLAISLVGCEDQTEMRFFGIVTDRNDETNEVIFDNIRTVKFEEECMSLFVVGKWYAVECERDSGDEFWTVAKLEWKNVEQ